MLNFWSCSGLSAALGAPPAGCGSRGPHVRGRLARPDQLLSRLRTMHHEGELLLKPPQLAWNCSWLCDWRREPRVALRRPSSLSLMLPSAPPVGLASRMASNVSNAMFASIVSRVAAAAGRVGDSPEGDRGWVPGGVW
jgi:hypothetical protein